MSISDGTMILLVVPGVAPAQPGSDALIASKSSPAGGSAESLGIVDGAVAVPTVRCLPFAIRIATRAARTIGGGVGFNAHAIVVVISSATAQGDGLEAT